MACDDAKTEVLNKSRRDNVTEDATVWMHEKSESSLDHVLKQFPSNARGLGSRKNVCILPRRLF